MKGRTALQQLDDAVSRRASALSVPDRFVDFCAWVGVTLSPGQRVIARVAYDGVDPVDLEQDERRLAAELFGPVERVPPVARGVVVAVCGARGGKTYVLVSLKLLHGALTRDLAPLAKGEEACAAIVGPSKKHAIHAVRMIRGALQSKPELAALILRDTAEQVAIRRPDGAIVTFDAIAAGRGGAQLRGRWYTDVALDEAAFFRDEDSGVVNDRDLYDAAAPRVLPGGSMVIASTPWLESGLLYEAWRDNYGKPTTSLVAHAPTLALQDTPTTRVIVERERAKDPDNAAREYDARFGVLGSNAYFDATALAKAIDYELKLPRAPKPGEQVTAGGDLAFTSDHAALAICHLSSRKVIAADLQEWTPEPGKPLRPSALIGEMAEHVRAHGAAFVIADGYYRETVAEHLAAAGLGLVDAPTGVHVDDPFMTVRMLLREGRLVLPNHPRLLAQLREVIGKPMAGGRLKPYMPRKLFGGHGDLVSALVLAAHQLAGQDVASPKPKPGDPGFADEEERALLEADMAEAERRAAGDSYFGEEWAAE